MSTFVAIEYDDPHKAEEVRLTLVKLQKEYLIDLEDAVVAVKDEAGKITEPTWVVTDSTGRTVAASSNDGDCECNCFDECETR